MERCVGKQGRLTKKARGTWLRRSSGERGNTIMGRTENDMKEIEKEKERSRETDKIKGNGEAERKHDRLQNT